MVSITNVGASKFSSNLQLRKLSMYLNILYPREQAADGGFTEYEKKWLEDDCFCYFIVLNAKTNSLFNVFHTYTIALDLGNALQRWYINKDASLNLFLLLSMVKIDYNIKFQA